MNDQDANPREELVEVLRDMERRLRRLTVAVVLMALALLLVASAVYGSLVNYFSGDVLLYGGTSIGAALLGFAFGWFARGRK